MSFLGRGEIGRAMRGPEAARHFIASVERLVVFACVLRAAYLGSAWCMVVHGL
jgi:hypothetical protein